MMINTRKILLLSALLISASSITAPSYAMNADEDVVQAPRAIHAGIPGQLTPDMIQDIRKNGSFLTAAKEYVLQNPDQLDMFENYLNPDYSSLSFPRHLSSYMDYSGLNYYIQEAGGSRYPNPNYDPARPEETGPEWIEDAYSMELSRLIFKEQDPASAKLLAVAPKVEEQEIGSGAASSVQVPMSSDSSSEVDSDMAIKSLFEQHGHDLPALQKALADLWKKRPFL